MNAQEMMDMYRSLIANTISTEEGGKATCWPHQITAIDQEDKKYLFAIAGGADDAVDKVITIFKGMKPKQMIYSLDRNGKPDQGTVLPDLVAGCHWYDGKWHPFIIEYQAEPLTVRPVEYGNEFWSRVLMIEVNQWMGQTRFEDAESDFTDFLRNLPKTP